MTYNELAKTIAKLEGKKSETRISDIREILKIITNILAEEVSEFKTTNECPTLKLLLAKAEKKIKTKTFKAAMKAKKV